MGLPRLRTTALQKCPEHTCMSPQCAPQKCLKPTGRSLQTDHCTSTLSTQQASWACLSCNTWSVISTKVEAWVEAWVDSAAGADTTEPQRWSKVGAECWACAGAMAHPLVHKVGRAFKLWMCLNGLYNEGPAAESSLQRGGSELRKAVPEE